MFNVLLALDCGEIVEILDIATIRYSNYRVRLGHQVDVYNKHLKGGMHCTVR